MKHSNGGECPSCKEKLDMAHEKMREFFAFVKGNHPCCHISWSYRGQKEQNEAFDKGLSKLRYPASKHNKTDEHGRPCAEALDLFLLISDKAEFPVAFYYQVHEELVAAKLDIRWGGNFIKPKDYDHFELIK